MDFCDHPNLGDDPRRDYCAECKYEYYYGDVTAGCIDLQVCKLINPGRDRKANGFRSCFEDMDQAYLDKIDREAWEDYHAQYRG